MADKLHFLYGQSTTLSQVTKEKGKVYFALKANSDATSANGKESEEVRIWFDATDAKRLPVTANYADKAGWSLKSDSANGATYVNLTSKNSSGQVTSVSTSSIEISSMLIGARISGRDIFLKNAREDEIKITLPSDNDTKVTQTVTDTTAANYEILFSNTADNTTRTEAARKSARLLFNPNSQTLTVKNIKGNATTATTASQLANSLLINGIEFNGSNDVNINLLPFIIGTQTTTTNNWTGVSTSIARLFDGLTIRYWLPTRPNSSAVTLTLTLSDGTTSTGAIPCYYSGPNRLTSHYGIGNIITLRYRENVKIDSTTIAKGWWADANYDSGNTDTRIRIYKQVNTANYNSDYPIIVSRTAASSIGNANDGSYTAVEGVIGGTSTKIPTINPQSGEIKAPLFTGTAETKAGDVSFKGTALKATADKYGTLFDNYTYRIYTADYAVGGNANNKIVSLKYQTGEGRGTSDDSKDQVIGYFAPVDKNSGYIPFKYLPPTVIERLTVVASIAARNALKNTQVQTGDVVKVLADENDGNKTKMFYVVDDTKLNSSDGYSEFVVGSAAKVPWGGTIDNRPILVGGEVSGHTGKPIYIDSSSPTTLKVITIKGDGTDGTQNAAYSLNLAFLPTAGGKMTGNITLSGTNSNINNTTTKILFTNSAGSTTYTQISADTSGKIGFLNSNGSLGVLYDNTNKTFRPVVNSQIDLGTSSMYWNRVYGTNFYGTNYNGLSLKISNSSTVAAGDSIYSEDSNASIVTAGGISAAGRVSANSIKIDNADSGANTQGCIMKYNSTYKCMEFIFGI